MNKPMCIQFSGLPGSGKTTLGQRLASRLSIPLLSKDGIDSVLLQDALTTGSTLTGYHLLMSIADYQLSLGVSIILDAVFPLPGFRQRVANIAEQHHAKLYIIHTFYSDEILYRDRMANRIQYHAGWTAKGWQEVERVRGFYETWSKNDVIRVNSVNSINSNLESILNHIYKDM